MTDDMKDPTPNAQAVDLPNATSSSRHHFLKLTILLILVGLISRANAAIVNLSVTPSAPEQIDFQILAIATVSLSSTMSTVTYGIIQITDPHGMVVGIMGETNPGQFLMTSANAAIAGIYTCYCNFNGMIEPSGIPWVASATAKVTALPKNIGSGGNPGLT